MPQPNMQQILKQAQKMQQDMLAAQEALKDEVVEASAGGGMVTAKVTGDLVVKSIAIDPQAVDPDDVELLQDMVMAAGNEALRSAQARAGAGACRASNDGERLRPARSAADHRAVQAPRRRRAHRAAARLPPAA